MRSLWWISGLVLIVAAAAGDAATLEIVDPSQIPEPGLTYGPSEALDLPKTILFSAGPEDIAKDAEEWQRRGIGAFFMDFVAREWSSDIWARDGKPWTIGESDETFQQAKRANEVCRRIGSETFLKIAFDHHFEWFNDLAWQEAYHNFQQFAIFARETGCTGMALDIEYVDQQYDFDWEGYDYSRCTREELVAKVRERMTHVLEVLYDEFPDMIFITFPEQGLCLGAHIHACWIEEAARRNAPGGIHYCTERTYRAPNIRYMFGHAWADLEVFQRLLSKRARRYWTEHCTIAAGVWPFGFDHQSVYEPGVSLDAFRQGYAASLMMSPRYNWIYSHNCREQLIGRELDKHTGEPSLQGYLDVIAKREIVTTPKYVELARELRSMHLRDYSEDIALQPKVTFEGPADLPEIRLHPTAWSPPAELEAGWELGMRYLQGEPINPYEYLRNPNRVDGYRAVPQSWGLRRARHGLSAGNRNRSRSNLRRDQRIRAMAEVPGRRQARVSRSHASPRAPRACLCLCLVLRRTPPTSRCPPADWDKRLR